MYADALITMRREAGQDVRFQHVRGHAGEEGNEGADALAVHGSRLGKVDARNWGKLRLQLEKGPVAESVDASVSLSNGPRAGKWLTSPWVGRCSPTWYLMKNNLWQSWMTAENCLVISTFFLYLQNKSSEEMCSLHRDGRTG